MWSAAILAGGHARRLAGQDKSALVVDGASVLARQLAAIRPLTGDIVLVGGPARDLPLPAVPDLRPGTGALGALYTALATSAAEQVLVLACDLPFVTTPFLSLLLRLGHNEAAVVPSPASGMQPLCAVYRTRAAASLARALDAGERRVRAAVGALQPRYVTPEELAPFDPDGRLLWNINTPEDYARATRASGSAGIVPQPPQ